MIKEFIPYNLALEIKQLGFDEPCQLGWYLPHSEIAIKAGVEPHTWQLIPTHPLLNQIAAPTFSQCFRFFRGKYNLVHEISWSKYKGGVSFDYDIFSLVLPTDDELGDENDIYIERPMETYDSLAGKTFRDMEFDSFEGAELAAIVKLIEIVKRKK
jgi:hypothetical protein